MLLLTLSHLWFIVDDKFIDNPEGHGFRKNKQGLFFTMLRRKKRDKNLKHSYRIQF